MANISGIPLSSISQIAGTNITSVINIGGLATSGIPGWPTAGPTCDRFETTYSEISLIAAANSPDIFNIEAGNDNRFYAEDFCGSDTNFADTGYYVVNTGRNLLYFYWNSETKDLIPQEPPAAGPTATAAPSFGIGELISGVSAPNITRGTWTGTGNISYLYKFYSDGGLIQTQGPFPFTNSKGDIIDTQPYFMPDNTVLFTTIRLEVSATDDVGTTTEYVEIRVSDSKLNTFLANSGITDPTRIAALEYLQKAILTSTSQLGSSAVNLDYYPFAGETAEQNKWSLSNPSEYLNFSGNWIHDRNGSQANYGIAQSTRPYTNSFNNVQFAYGMYTNTNNVEDFRDLRLDTGIYGAWDFGANRQVNGLNKVYWTAGATEYTSNDSAGSVGLSGLFRAQQSGLNRVSVISGGNLQSPVIFGGQWPLYIDSVFIIGGATKNYQFAFIGNFIGSESVIELNTILQTYNSMLGR